MNVKVKSKPQTIEQMLAREAEVGFEDAATTSMIAETYTDPKMLRTFGFSEAVQARGQALAEEVGDEHPEFVVVRTEEGFSKSGRLYDGTILESIAEQINLKQPIAHLGHIKDNDLGTALPDPQTTWIGAITRIEASEHPDNKGKKVKVIYTAGYNLPGAKIRTYLKANAVDSTSWQGMATQTPIPGQGVKVTTFDLHSLDWARKGSEGMPTARVVALAREMKEGRSTMGDDNKSLAEVTPDEFKEANPNGYALLVREISSEQEGTINDLTVQVEAAKADKTLLDEIRNVLKLAADADPLAQIGALVKKLGEKAKISVDEALDALLSEKVPDEETRKLVRRLLPVTEMQTAAEECDDKEAVVKLVSEMVNKSFDDDDIIQTYVSEQSPPLVRRQEQLKGGSEKLDLDKLGMTRSRVKMGA